MNLPIFLTLLFLFTTNAWASVDNTKIYHLQQSTFCQTAGISKGDENRYILYGNLSPNMISRPAQANTPKYALSSGFWRQYFFYTDEAAIIIAGGGPELNNWEGILRAATMAYKTMTEQMIKKDNIYFLSAGDLYHDVDGDRLSDITAKATAQELSRCFHMLTQKKLKQVIVFMVDHGDTDTYNLSATEILHARKDLSPMLDHVMDHIAGKLIFIYDACRSGSFIKSLSLRNSKKCIILTASRHDQDAISINSVHASFSQLFWGQIMQGDNLLDAFKKSYNNLFQIYKIEPQLDANANASPNERSDDNIAKHINIGYAITYSNNPPVLSGYPQADTHITDNSALIHVDQVVDASGIKCVWAIVVPPDYQATNTGDLITSIPWIELNHTDGNAYEATFTEFNKPGIYKISLYAEDGRADDSLISTPVHFNYIRKGILCGDLNGDKDITLSDLIISLNVNAMIHTEISKDSACLASGMAEAVYIMKSLGDVR